MKKQHLELQEKVEEAKADIAELKDRIINNPSPSQKDLKELQTKQARFKILEEELRNDSYSKTVSGLEELETAIREMRELEAANDLPNEIINTSHELYHSPVEMGENAGYTIAQFFMTRVNAIREAVEKRQRLPEPEQSHDEDQNRNNNDGDRDDAHDRSDDDDDAR